MWHWTTMYGIASSVMAWCVHRRLTDICWSQCHRCTHSHMHSAHTIFYSSTKALRHLLRQSFAIFSAVLQWMNTTFAWGNRQQCASVPELKLCTVRSYKCSFLLFSPGPLLQQLKPNDMQLLFLHHIFFSWVRCPMLDFNRTVRRIHRIYEIIFCYCVSLCVCVLNAANDCMNQNGHWWHTN